MKSSKLSSKNNQVSTSKSYKSFQEKVLSSDVLKSVEKKVQNSSLSISPKTKSSEKKIEEGKSSSSVNLEIYKLNEKNSCDLNETDLE